MAQSKMPIDPKYFESVRKLIENIPDCSEQGDMTDNEFFDYISEKFDFIKKSTEEMISEMNGNACEAIQDLLDIVTPPGADLNEIIEWIMKLIKFFLPMYYAAIAVQLQLAKEGALIIEAVVDKIDALAECIPDGADSLPFPELTIGCDLKYSDPSDPPTEIPADDELPVPPPAGTPIGS